MSEIIPDGTWVSVTHPGEDVGYYGEVIGYRSNAATTGLPVYKIQPDRAKWGIRVKPMWAPAELVAVAPR